MGRQVDLLRALLGLLPLHAGTVDLDGRVATWSRRELAEWSARCRSASRPFRSPCWSPCCSAAGRSSASGAGGGRRSCRRRRDAPPLRRLGTRGRPVDTLSAANGSGCAWRALVASPRLLLLDEPTAALDVGHEMELFELLRRLATEGLGVLVITPTQPAARFADRLILLDRGRTVAEGRPPEVLREDVVSAVFGWPVAVTSWCDGAPQVVPLRRAEAAESGRALPPLREDPAP
jgi:iron complex transport system ATP-binding protein